MIGSIAIAIAIEVERVPLVQVGVLPGDGATQAPAAERVCHATRKHPSMAWKL